MSLAVAEFSAWWGACRVPHGQVGRWRIGPMTLWIQRLRGEWRLAHSTEDADSDQVSIDLEAEGEDLMAKEQVSRYGVSDESESVRLTPLLADRPVVTSPDKPFYVPSEHSVTLYVGSPLWVRVEVGDPPIQLTEFPILRPSDTWFGPSTYRGELCYATRTSCRLQLDELPVRPHRAITAMLVRNRARAPLLLERMKLPVGYLSLYHVSGGRLWTRDLSVSNVEGQDLAVLSYGEEVPSRGGKATLVSPARHKAEGNAAMRVFASLFAR